MYVLGKDLGKEKLPSASFIDMKNEARSQREIPARCETLPLNGCVL